MSLLMKTAPLAMHGGAVYPYSQELADRYHLESRFEEPYDLCLQQGSELWLPRRLAPAGGADLREDGKAYSFKVKFTPKHADQARVVAESCNLLTVGKSHIVQAPTGYGKTYVGARLAGHVGRYTLALTTKEDLLNQWRKAARDVLGLPDDLIGEWRGDVLPRPDQPFVVALVHSVMKGFDRYPAWLFKQFGFVICDEVHRMGADQFSQAMWWLPARLRLGLSATPSRKDGKDVVFISHIGDVDVIGTQETLIPKVIMEHMPWKCPRRTVMDKKTKKIKLERVPHKAGRTMHILKTIASDVATTVKIAKFTRLAYEKGRTTIVFSDTMDHLRILRASILKSGVPESDTGWYVGLDSGVYFGSKVQREKTREQAKIKRVMFATYKMCSEGTDIPWLDTAVLAGPRGDVNQIVGRIRREYEGKKEPLVYHPVYKDSPVFSSYAATCLRWYKSLGAKVLVYR